MSLPSPSTPAAPSTPPIESRPSVRSTVERGAAAEALVASYLEARGLTIVARNLRCAAGELDLVCLDGELLVIVEVRQRVRRDFGGSLASVTLHKQRKLIRATRFFWQRRPDWRDRILRFDVVGLSGPADSPQIEWIKDAFRCTR